MHVLLCLPSRGLWAISLCAELSVTILATLLNSSVPPALLDCMTPLEPQCCFAHSLRLMQLTSLGALVAAKWGCNCQELTHVLNSPITE